MYKSWHFLIKSIFCRGLSMRNKHFLQLLAAVLPLLAADVFAAENLVVNGGFEKYTAGSMPEKWNITQSNAEGVVGVTDQDAVDGAALSIELKTLKKSSGFVGAVQSIFFPALKEKKLVRIRGMISGRDLQASSLVAICGTAGKNGKMTLWKTIYTKHGSFDWESFSCEVEVPAASQYLSLSFRSMGPGVLKLDNIQCFWHEAGKNSELQALNGSFKGRVNPDNGLYPNWRAKLYHGRETIGDYSSANGKTVMIWKSGAQGFGIEPELTGMLTPGVYQASAFFKTAGKGRIAAECFASSGQSLGEQQSEDFTSVQGKRCNFVFQVPVNAGKVNIYLLNQGKQPVEVSAFELKKISNKLQLSKIPFETEVYPPERTKLLYGKSTLSLIENFPLPLAFNLKGDRSLLNKPTLVVDLPEKVRLRAAFTNQPSFYQEERCKIENIVRNGKKYYRYRIENAEVFKHILPVFRADRKITLALEAAAGSTGASDPVYYRLENNGIADDWVTLNLNILPPLKKIDLPDTFRIYRWHAADFYYPAGKLLNRTWDQLALCGVTSSNGFYGDRPQREIYKQAVRARGMQFYNSAVNDNALINLYSKEEIASLGKYQETVSHGRSIHVKRFCPQYTITSAAYKKIHRARLARELKDMRAGDIVAMDYEPWDMLYWCYCQNCLSEFARINNLSKTPTPDQIRAGYESQWIKFRSEQAFRFIRQEAEFIREIVPGVILADYDYIMDFDNPEALLRRCCKDPRLLDEILDMHIPSYYHHIGVTAFNAMRDSVSNLKKPIMPICAIDGPISGYLAPGEVLNAAQIRLFTLAAAVNGCPGIWIFPGIHIDASYFAAFNQAMGEIAAIEKYCLPVLPESSDIKIKARSFSSRTINAADKLIIQYFPDWNESAAFRSVKPSGDRAFSAMLNYSNKDALFAIVKVKLDKGDYTLYDIAADKVVLSNISAENLASQGVLIKIAPEDAALLEIRPADSNDANLPSAEKQDELEKQFQQIKQQQTGKNSFKTIKNDKFQMQVCQKDQIEVRGVNFSAIMHEKSAYVISLTANGRTFKGAFGEEMIWAPQQYRRLTAQWQIPSGKLSADGKAQLSYKGVIEGLNVKLEKVFTFDQTGTVTVDYRIDGQLPADLLVKTRVFKAPDTKGIVFGDMPMLKFAAGERSFAGSDSQAGGLPGDRGGQYKVNKVQLPGSNGTLEVTFSAFPAGWYSWASSDMRTATLEWAASVGAVTRYCVK